MMSRLQTENDELNQQISTLTEEYDDLSIQVSETNLERESLQEQIQSLEEVNDQINVQLSDAKQQVSLKEGLI